MDYVLYAYGAVVLSLVLLAAAIGRQLSHTVSDPIEPSYREGSPSWRAQQERASRRIVPAPAFFGTAVRGIVVEPVELAPTADEVAAEVEELERQLARVTAPEVEGAAIIHWEGPATYVQAELGETGGAELWGNLLKDMSTEERTIYDVQMHLDHQESKAVERGFLSDLDRTVNHVLAELSRANEAAERRARFWDEQARRRADFVDVPTGAWPMLQSV